MTWQGEVKANRFNDHSSRWPRLRDDDGRQRGHASDSAAPSRLKRLTIGRRTQRLSIMLNTRPTTVPSKRCRRRCGAALVVVASALAVTCRAPGPTVPQGEAALVALQQDLAEAWLSADRPTLERIIASEWTITGPDGRMSDRARVLAQVFETGVHKIHNLKIDEVRARVFGDAAVVTGRTRGTGEFEGAGYDVVVRFTDVFVRRAGRWQAVASHASLVRE